MFSMFLKLAGRRCLVVGGGLVAEAKIESLLRSGAAPLVVAPKATSKVAQWASEHKLLWRPVAFHPADLDGIFLVIAATSSTEINDLVFQEATRRAVLCNVVDDPERCDFYCPAVVRRGQLQIAVSTGGLSPALSQRIRYDLEERFGIEYATWLEQLGRTRRALLATPMGQARRRDLLHRLASHQAFREFVRAAPAMQGRSA